MSVVENGDQYGVFPCAIACVDKQVAHYFLHGQVPERLSACSACSALRWDEAGAHYRCGVLEDAKSLAAAPGRWQRWRGRLWLRIARRWIAAGAGCDADLVEIP